MASFLGLLASGVEGAATQNVKDLTARDTEAMKIRMMETSAAIQDRYAVKAEGRNLETFKEKEKFKRGLLDKDFDAETDRLVGRQAKLAEAGAVVKRKITKDSAIVSIMDAGFDKTEAEDIYQKTKRKALDPEGKPIPAETKWKILVDAKAMVQQTTGLEPGLKEYDQAVDLEYKKGLARIKGGKSLSPAGEVESERGGSTIEDTVITVPQEAVDELLTTGNPKERAEQEILNIENISGRSRVEKDRAIATVQAALKEALKKQEERKSALRPTLLGPGATDFPIGPVVGKSVLK